MAMAHTLCDRFPCRQIRIWSRWGEGQPAAIRVSCWSCCVAWGLTQAAGDHKGSKCMQLADYSQIMLFVLKLVLALRALHFILQTLITLRVWLVSGRALQSRLSLSRKTVDIACFVRYPATVRTWTGRRSSARGLPAHLTSSERAAPRPMTTGPALSI